MSAAQVDAPPALEVSGLHVRYGQFTAVHDLSLDVRAGELVVLLGANGAGKSSFLRTVMGIERAAEGEVVFGGRRLGKLPTHRRVGLGLGYLPEGRGVFPTMTVEENILAGLQSVSRRGDSLDAAYSLFPRLAERRRQMAGSLSGGEQQMLSLSRALAGDPSFLLLDELSLGLAPAIVVQLFSKIGELRDQGKSILLVEQFAHAALQIADRAGIMVRGRLAGFGPAEHFARMTADELAGHYFGGGEA